MSLPVSFILRNHISGTDNATAMVVVTNGQRLFKSENISVGNNGHFLPLQQRAQKIAPQPPMLPV